MVRGVFVSFYKARRYRGSIKYKIMYRFSWGSFRICFVENIQGFDLAEEGGGKSILLTSIQILTMVCQYSIESQSIAVLTGLPLHSAVWLLSAGLCKLFCEMSQ